MVSLKMWTRARKENIWLDGRIEAFAYGISNERNSHVESKQMNLIDAHVYSRTHGSCTKGWQRGSTAKLRSLSPEQPTSNSAAAAGQLIFYVLSEHNTQYINPREYLIKTCGQWFHKDLWFSVGDDVYSLQIDLI